MAPSSRSRSKRSGTLRAYNSPLWRNPLFWIALGLSLVIGLVAFFAQLMILGTPSTTIGWVWSGALTASSVWVGFVLISLGLNTARGVERGVIEADSERGARYEEHGRRAGRVVGTGLAKVTGRSKGRSNPTVPDDTAIAPSGDAGESDSDDEQKPTLDDAARSLGMMVGRRLGARRDKE